MCPARPRRFPRHTSRRVIAALAAAALGTVAGCGSISDAQRVIDRSHLVNELASRLDRAEASTYTADYQLPAGARATIAQAQDPIRTVYAHADGKFTTTPEATMDCRVGAGVPTCTLTEPPSPSADATTTLLNTLRDRGLVPPTLVIGLLTAASLSPDTVIKQHDTTLAGEHATCVTVTGVADSPAPAFDACITSTGVLGSFKGDVNGTPMEISLVRYTTSVAEDAFALPAGAQLVDQRPAKP
jgi:hypothetical protein